MIDTENYVYALNEVARPTSAVPCTKCGKLHEVHGASFLVASAPVSGPHAGRVNLEIGFRAEDIHALLHEKPVSKSVRCRSRACIEDIMRFIIDEYDETYTRVILRAQKQFEERQAEKPLVLAGIPDAYVGTQTKFADYPELPPLPGDDGLAPLVQPGQPNPMVEGVDSPTQLPDPGC